MSYTVLETLDKDVTIYSNGSHSCISVDPEFQSWLRDNQDTLPDDIQAKIDAGELTIADAD
jgi:hypothetical protein